MDGQASPPQISSHSWMVRPALLRSLPIHGWSGQPSSDLFPFMDGQASPPQISSHSWMVRPALLRSLPIHGWSGQPSSDLFPNSPRRFALSLHRLPPSCACFFWQSSSPIPCTCTANLILFSNAFLFRCQSLHLSIICNVYSCIFLMAKVLYFNNVIMVVLVTVLMIANNTILTINVITSTTIMVIMTSS